MNDRPSVFELLHAVREWLREDALPALKKQGALGFQALIADRALSIVQREVQHEEEHLQQESRWLSSRLLMTTPTSTRISSMRQLVQHGMRELCEQIRQGDYDERDACLELIGELRQSVGRKLEVNNPRALARD